MPHLGDAYSLAHWLTGDAADADDVVQEASLRAFRAIGSYGGRNARSWTLTIVRNTAFSWLAKHRRGTVVAVDDLEAVERAQALPGREGAQANPATPETELIAKADAARLEAAIAGLPMPFRETLVLRDLQGLDYREIAEVTEVPVGTVMSRLARARRRLMETIGSKER
jgi:RNA polymerase sigma-70 factor (ECF subfamily)